MHHQISLVFSVRRQIASIAAASSHVKAK